MNGGLPEEFTTQGQVITDFTGTVKLYHDGVQLTNINDIGYDDYLVEVNPYEIATIQDAPGYYIVKGISIEEYDDTYYIANLDGEPLLYIPREDNYEIAPGLTYDIVFAQMYYSSRYSYPLSINSNQIYLESITECEGIE